MALLHVKYLSEALYGLHIGVDVILPQTEVPEHGHRVLWLLHGMSDNETMWQRRTSIERYADAHNIAVVMPAVQLSCYSDMAHGYPFYTFVTDELPRVMREFFPFSARREDNYVAGLSMGGEGAAKIGLSKPENYAVIGILSAGAFNHPWTDSFDLSNPFSYRMYLCHDGKTLSGSPEDCFENAKHILADGRPTPRIYHAIGTEDFLLASAHETRDFFASLDGNPFDYFYEEHPGAHTWEFWDAHIQRFLDFIDRTGDFR
ncbi:MAG: esterase family protein [Clostridia bacterium]|nr:esterase family protein [Clostridia bacterium]